MRSRRGWMLAAVLVVLAGAVGCGGSSDEEGVEDAVGTYLTSLATADGATACDQLTGPQARLMFEEALLQLPELQATSCADALTKLSGSLGAEEKDALESADVINVQIDGSSATAEVAGGTESVDLEKADDRWLISGGLALGGR